MGIYEIALYVNYLEKSKLFYVKYFNAVANEKCIHTSTELESYTLTFDDGSKLRLIARPEIISSKKFLYDSGYSYITIKIGGKEKLEEILCRLKHDGYRILTKHTVGEDGMYECILLDPENNQIVIIE